MAFSSALLVLVSAAAASLRNDTIPVLQIVETLPPGTGQPLKGGMLTGDALAQLVDECVSELSFTVMYWNLLAQPVNGGWSKDDLIGFGSEEGHKLFTALMNAAKRGVHIRILNSAGTESNVSAMQQNMLYAFPNVEHRHWNASEWYGSGIMHQKFWVCDGKHFYLGSANQDWKSLAQVKEMGIMATDSPDAATDLLRHFEAFWIFATTTTKFPDPPTMVTGKEDLGADLIFPSWSPEVPVNERAQNPLATSFTRTKYSQYNQLPIKTEGGEGTLFITGSPRAALAGDRTWDLDGLLYTIKSCEEYVYLSVMDWLPSSSLMYMTLATLWWPALQDALLQASLARRCEVRMLLSVWNHTDPAAAYFLRALQTQASVCRDPKAGGGKSTCAPFTIRSYIMPGWNATGNGTASEDQYPPFTRVNHAKYIVTDKRGNVGTSNMEWSYMYQTAGASFNTNHPSIVRGLTDAFLRDWNGPNSFPLS
eukprot:Hpha_TRINITY_DN16845_c0_g1::TRINITY_DN16845_c0_g1_i1::g.149910::m.149910/K16860/PLD3_4; phospholipase D3/4